MTKLQQVVLATAAEVIEIGTGGDKLFAEILRECIREIMDEHLPARGPGPIPSAPLRKPKEKPTSEEPTPKKLIPSGIISKEIKPWKFNFHPTMAIHILRRIVAGDKLDTIAVDFGVPYISVEQFQAGQRFRLGKIKQLSDIEKEEVFVQLEARFMKQYQLGGQAA
jgi:hypothetical protein